MESLLTTLLRGSLISSLHFSFAPLMWSTAYACTACVKSDKLSGAMLWVMNFIDSTAYLSTSQYSIPEQIELLVEAGRRDKLATIYEEGIASFAAALLLLLPGAALL